MTAQEIKAFEKWMKSYFNEPEWDEGYTRSDLQDAFRAGIDYNMDKTAKLLRMKGR